MTQPLDDRKKSERGPRGRFAPGNKLSPGRPPGRGPGAELRAVLATDLDKIIGVLRTQALAAKPGCVQVALVFPRVGPHSIDKAASP